MREMTPEEVAAKIILSRKLVKDNAKEIEREAFRLRMVAARKIENKFHFIKWTYHNREIRNFRKGIRRCSCFSKKRTKKSSLKD